jgi:hypothetical protein
MLSSAALRQPNRTWEAKNGFVPGITTPMDRAVMTATMEAYPECPVPAFPLHALVKVAEVVGRKQLVGPVFVRQKHHSQVLCLERASLIMCSLRGNTCQSGVHSHGGEYTSQSRLKPVVDQFADGQRCDMHVPRGRVP